MAWQNNRMSIPIALQLYSVRDDAAKDLFSVLGQVAQMGYDGVEFAGFYGNDPADIRKALDDNGLMAAGTHTPLNALEEERFAQTVQAHHTLNCPYVIVPSIPENLRNTSEACRATGKVLTELAARVRPEGLQLGFHAHAQDMRALPDGTTAWDVLAESTPLDFILQYDTANGMDAGADPVKPIVDWPGRAISVHLKEYAGRHGAVIGKGDIPWTRVFQACETVGGTKWYVVEQESDAGVTPMEAVDQCLKNLRAMGK